MAKHRPRAFHALLILSVLLLTAACLRHPAAFEYQSTSDDGWEPGDTLRFHIDSLHHRGNYNLSLGLRTSASTPYPFQSIWLVVRQQWHNPDTLMTDTVECRMTNSKGDVTGKGVSVYAFTKNLKQLSLPQGTSADITINHIMRREVLPGVINVGIRLDPTK